MSAQLLYMALAAFGFFCIVILGVIYMTGQIRAGCETPFGKFFVETKGRPDKLSEREKKRLR
jgi:hypothetical protein